jgi:glycosyltransferase involved in cell wall biosynthesis
MIKSNFPHILHLARWYPNRNDSMFGLFVKQHVEAVAHFTNSHLIYVQPINNLESRFEIQIVKNNNFSEILVYYRDINLSIPGLTELLKAFRYYHAVYKGFAYLKANNLRFDFIHVHVLTRLGLVALFVKLIYNIPFGITEHWSRYLPATNGFRGCFRKNITRKIVANATFVSTVTENLHQAMLKHKLLNDNYFILPNIVNPKLKFISDFPKENKFTFLHISTFEDKSKNISGIINVISKLEQERNDFRFVFVGDGLDFKKMLALAQQKIKNTELYHFTGILENEHLAEIIMGSHLLVIFSNYENFPVVINECLSFGLPILSTNVGGISEVINDNNGVLINPNAEDELLVEMKNFLNGNYNFDSPKIRAEFEMQFSMESVGKLLIDKYNLAFIPK